MTALQHTLKNPVPPLSRFFWVGMSPLISSNHFFLCGNRDVPPERVYLVPPSAVMYGTRRHLSSQPVPRGHYTVSFSLSFSVPFHGKPMNFMGSLMKSFQNSPPRTAVILSRLNWTNRISSESNLRPRPALRFIHLSRISSPGDSNYSH